MKSQVTFLNDIFQRNYEETLIIDSVTGEQWTYGRFLSQAIKMSDWIGSDDLKSAKVLLASGNKVNTLLAYFACIIGGAVVVPVNNQFKKKDFKHAFESANVKLALVDSTTKDRFDFLKTDIGGNNSRLFNLDSFDQGDSEERVHFTSPFSSDDVFEIIFSSGTTGLPKAIPIKFGSILSNGKAFTEMHGIKSGSRFLNYLPLCYLGGWYNLFLIPIICESSVVLEPPFGPANAYGFWETLKKYDINVLWFSPTILSMLLKIGVDDDLEINEISRSVRKAFVGMAPLPSPLKAEFENQFKIRLLENYGMTETFFIASETEKSPRIEGSSGELLPGVEICFGSEKSLEYSGELLVKSPYMIDQYYNAEPSEKHFFDGYFRTGDIGKIDSNSCLHITGRAKDTIIRGGININPIDIESVALGYEGVSESVAFGLPHDVYGEVVGLAISVKEGAGFEKESFQQYLKDELPQIKWPDRIDIMTSLPKNASGKLDRRVTREQVLNH